LPDVATKQYIYFYYNFKTIGRFYLVLSY